MNIPKWGLIPQNLSVKILKEKKKTFTKASFINDYMLGTLAKLNSCYVN